MGAKKIGRRKADGPSAAALCGTILGAEGERLLGKLRAVSPDMARLFVAYPFGEIYSRPGLDLRTRELVAIASVAAMGTARPQLVMHVHAALRAGCSRAEVLEVLLMTSVFAGFPAAVNGIDAAREAFDAFDGAPMKEKK
jgi:4-carboxymuconolactone decarboxylase